MTDEIIECIGCGRAFVWRDDDQQAFRSRGEDAPKRCPDCRSRCRVERQPRVQGLIGNLSPASSNALSGSTIGSVPRVERAPSIPLWRDLSRAEHYRHVSRFMHMTSLDLSSLTVTEIAHLIQWILERRGLEADSVEEKGGKIDLTLTNKRFGRREFVRFYYEERGTPLNALWDLFSTLRGTHFSKMHCITVDTFTEAQKRTRNEHPLALRLVEREDLERYLREAQWSYHVELESRSARLVTSRRQARRGGGFIRKLVTWLRGSLSG